MDDLTRPSLEPLERFARQRIITPLHHLHAEVDRLFHDYAPKIHVTMPWRGSVAGKHPIPVDVTLTEQGVDVWADVPGMEEDALDITLSGQSLIIEGTRQELSHETDDAYLHRECGYGAFQRIIDLPIQPNEKKIAASLQDGVLHVHVPEAAATKAQIRKIKLRQD